jgi:Ca-activated chloride channel homolog
MSSLSLALTVILAADAANSTAAAEHFSDPFVAYAAGAFDQALKLFVDAEVEHPKDARIAYDIGNAHFRRGDFDAAAQAYRRALVSQDPTLRAQANYNLGNALFRGQKLEEAVGAYEEALKLAPKDSDAQYNLDAARRALAVRQQQPPEQNKDKQSSQEKKSNDEKQGAQSQGGEPQGSPPQPSAKASGNAGDEQKQHETAGQQNEQGASDATKQQGAGDSQKQQGAVDAPKQQGAGDSQKQQGTAAQGNAAAKAGADGTQANKPGTLSREAAERYLQQVGDTGPRLPRNQRGGRSSTPDKDW